MHDVGRGVEDPRLRKRQVLVVNDGGASETMKAISARVLELAEARRGTIRS
jgi:hypothetical protein